MEKEKIKPSLSEYIHDNSEVVAKRDTFTDEMVKFAEPAKGLLGYYDSENVRFSVEGYDFVYFNNDGDLCRVKIRPDEISDLEKAGKPHESDELEDKLGAEGFQLDPSEKFRSALYRQLNEQI